LIDRDLIENGKQIIAKGSFLFNTVSKEYANIVIFLSLSTLLMGGISAKADPLGIEIGKTSSFVDEDGIMHLYGEVKNVSNKPLANVVIKGSFYGNRGNLLNEFNRSAELSTIGPGGISPFEILYLDGKTVNQIKSFKLSSGANMGPLGSKLKPVGLKIIPSNSRLDLFGFYYINGRVNDIANHNSTNTLIIATLYDKNGNVIAIGRGLAEPVNITAGSSAAFGLAVSEKLQTYKTVAYSIVADSNDLSSTPAFVRVSR